MLKRNISLPSVTVLVGAVAAWLLCAGLLLTAGTILANTAGMGEQGLGFLSSGISFLCAAAAGIAAARRSEKRNLISALLIASALIMVLLTIGFLLHGRELDPSSVLSLASFSYAGVLLGYLILYSPRNHDRKHSVRKIN
jgi:hypothetical protein